MALAKKESKICPRIRNFNTNGYGSCSWSNVRQMHDPPQPTTDLKVRNTSPNVRYQQETV